VMVRWLQEHGLEAASLRTRYEGELAEDSGEEEPLEPVAVASNGDEEPIPNAIDSGIEDE